MVEKLFILGGNPRKTRRVKRTGRGSWPKGVWPEGSAGWNRRTKRLRLERMRRNPAVGAGDPIPAILRKGMKPIRDRQARRRSKRGGLRAGSPEALAWGRKMKRARYRKAHPAVKRTRKVPSVARKSTRKGVRQMAKKRKRRGGMRKGSPAAKAWGRKMARKRAAKRAGRTTKRHYKKHTVRHSKKRSGGKKVRHYRRRMKVRRLMVPAAWGKGYRRRGFKRIRVMSNPTGKLFDWLKFGGMVLAGFAGATAASKLLNDYVIKGKVPPLVTSIGVAVLTVLFGKKLWRRMPESVVTGVVANAMLSAVVAYAPSNWLGWVVPEGMTAQAALPPATGEPSTGGIQSYIPSTRALQDYGNPYDTFGGDSNPLTASPFAGGIY